MLLELRVENLGIISELQLLVGSGMTAITGETGAGKTLIVEALELLLGGRADAGLVRSGTDEARAEARFEIDGVEVVLARVLPVHGRSRAYIDGRLATAAELVAVGRSLVDLHGQHDQQSLLVPAEQRRYWIRTLALRRLTRSTASAWRAPPPPQSSANSKVSVVTNDREREKSICCNSKLMKSAPRNLKTRMKKQSSSRKLIDSAMLNRTVKHSTLRSRVATPRSTPPGARWRRAAAERRSVCSKSKPAMRRRCSPNSATNFVLRAKRWLRIRNALRS